jgi:hypothetical protein
MMGNPFNRSFPDERLWEQRIDFDGLAYQRDALPATIFLPE